MPRETFDTLLTRALVDESTRIARAEKAEFVAFRAQFDEGSEVLRRRVSGLDAYRRTATRPRVPPCLGALGLDETANADDVRKAFRRLAFATHPDRGGTVAAFLALETAYQAALSVVASAA